MKTTRLLAPLLALVSVLGMLLTGCSTSGTVDYAQAERWLAQPSAIDKPVDVFYLYPSAYYKESPDSPNLAEIDDPGMVEGAKKFIGFQASAFETVGNLYAPYYRQVDVAYGLNLSESDHEKVMKGDPTLDATAAFAYYIEHYNGGRPFILAGHSQGSNVLLYLLSGYLKEHPDVYERMVAAYLIGYPVTGEYLDANPHLKFATGAADTGVIISYNTEAPGVTERNPVLLPNARVINPLSWTTAETTVPADQNLGSLAFNPDLSPILGPDGSPTPVQGLADATVDQERGVVICSTAPVDQFGKGSDVFPRGVFHGHDYTFYYFNLRANAEERAAAYLEANPR